MEVKKVVVCIIVTVVLVIIATSVVTTLIVKEASAAEATAAEAPTADYGNALLIGTTNGLTAFFIFSTWFVAFGKPSREKN